eukprot:gnl/TRDRNA2_/TRDRNA2_175969_c1_seq3.p1 gnl/TRDRNA2_/TRDRNA2_175969_c1~~gnl/TRDRNA2_/TRDRNA2_175969_c1_seq3.p1  ORF type:complete len:413 (+),score=69.03 gnl/TRDRNA2_/TRDRNA2_175969_c1_seq3:57-1241(+)
MAPKPKAKPKPKASELASKSSPSPALVSKCATAAQAITEVFAKFDVNKDGVIDQEELTRTIQKLQPRFSKEDCAELFKSADANHDGKIHYAEFVAWLCSEEGVTASDVLTELGVTPGWLKDGVLDRIVVSPYGVLGMQLTGSGEMVRNAQEPDSQIAIMDPAGLPFIQTDGPSLAGGAAGVIYQWLGIGEEPSFPKPVRSAIQAPLQAKFHKYGEKKCIHVVGPDFNREEYCTRQQALAELAEAYRAAFAEFSASGERKFRLLPLSGGIFAGPFRDEMPKLTAAAVQQGFLLLAEEQQKLILCAERLEMCIFTEDDLPSFKEIFASSAQKLSSNDPLAKLHGTMEVALNTNFGKKADFKLKVVGSVGDPQTFFPRLLEWSHLGKDARPLCVRDA